MGVLYLFVCVHICSKNAARSACTLYVKLICTPMLNHFDVLQAGSLPVAGRCARAVLGDLARDFSGRSEGPVGRVVNEASRTHARRYRSLRRCIC